MGFKKATKKNVKLRLALCGTAGSGKTFSALKIGVGLGKKVALIDTERGSASLYADQFDFAVQELDEYDPRAYMQAMHDAAKAGFDVLIIDSLSHAWAGEGGILDIAGKGKNKFTEGWKKATPLQNRLIDRILDYPGHVIITLRTKTEYVIEEKKNRNGKTVQAPRKVGMAPIQRAGVEYEFSIIGDMDAGNLTISKSRCSDIAIDKQFFHPGEDFAEILNDWLGEESTQPKRPQSHEATEGKRYGEDRKGGTAKEEPAPIRPNEDTIITKAICPTKFYLTGLEGKRLGDDSDDVVKDYQGKTYTFHLKDKSITDLKADNSPVEFEWLMGVGGVRKRRKDREEEETRELKEANTVEARELGLLAKVNSDQLKGAYKLASMRPVENDKSLETIAAGRLAKLITAFIEAGKAQSAGKPKAGNRKRSIVRGLNSSRGLIRASLESYRAQNRESKSIKAKAFRAKIMEHLVSLGPVDGNQKWIDLCRVGIVPPGYPIEECDLVQLRRMAESLEPVNA